MNTTKKLLVMVMVAFMAAMSVMPSTFSWYSHNTPAEGKRINYNRDELPISMKSGSNKISIATYEINSNGEYILDSNDDKIPVTTVSVTHDVSQKAIKYYRTILTNTGTNDVMADLNVTNLGNNADFSIGTMAPTLNEKAYASKASKTKKSNTTTRVYFKSNSGYASFWGEGNGTFNPNQAIGSNNSTNDMNVAYRANGANSDTLCKMNVCPNADSTSSDSGTTAVYYYDIPSDAEYFFFFNHWYLKSTSNPEWNRTIDITDAKTKGRLFYLTGNKVDNKWKEYKVRDVNTNYVGVNEYYDTVSLSTGSGVYADIGLKKESDDDDEDFIPEWYGSNISYSVDPASNVVSVSSKDGIITPKTSGTATIKTRITGSLGDYTDIYTTVKIDPVISQVPVLKNIKIPAPGQTDSDGNAISNKVEIDWYALNKSVSADMPITNYPMNIFFTI